MQLNLPPDLEALVQKRLVSGAFANAEEVIRHALEARKSAEFYRPISKRAFLQSERGELKGSDEASRESGSNNGSLYRERYHESS